MLLGAYLSANDIPIPVFAKNIEVTVQAVHRYVNGHRIPRAAVMDKIAKVTRGAVLPNDFFGTVEQAVG